MRIKGLPAYQGIFGVIYAAIFGYAAFLLIQKLKEVYITICNIFIKQNIQERSLFPFHFFKFFFTDIRSPYNISMMTIGAIGLCNTIFEIKIPS